MPTIIERIQNGWNAFRGRDHPVVQNYGPSSYYNPDKAKLRTSGERSIITSIYNRISLDVAANKIEHVKIDQNGRYKETVNDGLNSCLTLEANIDQTSRAFIQDAVLSMFDEGCVALVPIAINKAGEITNMRVGHIMQWYPKHIKIQVYNENTGMKEELVIPKSLAAIIQNPFYTVMNEPNSTLQRLIRKLNMLDTIDEQSAAGKLDLIIQLPYTVKSPTRKEQAEQRRKDIEQQLAGTKYGIAYTEATEKITQLNRPIENNLMGQIEYLTNTLYSQLGITPEILNGTSDEKAMLNYNSRTIEPILAAFTDEMKRKFLTKTARTQGHSVMYFNEPFRLVPINNIADIADKFTRNEILSPNEIRGIIGFRPSDSEQADELRNRNISQANEQGALPPDQSTTPEVPTANDQNGMAPPAEEGTDELDPSLGDIPLSEI